MADFQNLKTAIAEVIKQNGNEEITGDVLQYVLLEMVTALGGGQRFGGVINPESEPSATDGAMFYIGGHGTYTNLAGISVTVSEGQIGIFMCNGTWSARIITVSKPVDQTLTEDGQNPVEGGAIYAEFEKLRAAGYLFAGMAVPTSRPPQNLTEKIFYIATQAGHYQYFGGAGLNLDRGFNIISFDGENWSNQLVFAMTDTVENEGTGLVTSGGVYGVVSNKVDKETGKGLSQENFTTGEKAKLGGLPTAQELIAMLALKQNTLTFDQEPTELSNNPVTSGGVYEAIKYFITRAVDDLINYYTKSQTYTKTEVNDLVAAIKQFNIVVVPELPEPPSAETMGTLYLVPSELQGENNVKDEYITIRSLNEYEQYVYSWEKIGTTEIDLSNYTTFDDVNTMIATALADYYTKTQVDDLLAAAKGVLAALSLTASVSLVKTGVATSIDLAFKSNVACSAITLKRGASTIATGTGLTLGFTDVLTAAEAGMVTYTVEATIGGQSRSVEVTVEAVDAVYYGGGTDVSQIVATPSARRTPAGRYSFTIQQAQSNIYVLVPMTMSVEQVTMGGLDVPMDAPTGVVVGSLAYKCYKSSNTYDAGDYVINVY